jgi:hypothetical protein
VDRTVEQRFLVLLIREDPEVERARQIGDPFELRPRVHNTGWVVAITHDQQLGLAARDATQGIEVEAPLGAVPRERDWPHMPTGHTDGWLGAGVFRVE